MLPISDIIIRSISGYTFLLPLLIIYFMRKPIKQNFLHIITTFIFIYYLFGVLTVTGIGYTGSMSFNPRISLIPIINIFNSPLETILNIILFVPLGFFLPLLYNKYHKLSNIILTAFIFSSTIELWQMFDWGATDINDLITNTTGAYLGYLTYYVLSKYTPTNFLNYFLSKDINDTFEILLFITGVFIIMLTIQPWFVHTVLNIA